MRLLTSLPIVTIFLLAPMGLRAERKHTVGAQVDFSTGVTNQVGDSFNLHRLGEGRVPFYAVYPSLHLKSEGRMWLLETSYSFMGERFRAEGGVDSMSHVLAAGFSSRLAKRLRLKLANSFHTAPDFVTYNVLTGIALTPQGFSYVFDPLLLRRSSLSNYASGSLELDVGPASYLTFGAASSYRHYEETAEFEGRLADQLRTEGSLAFSHRRSSHGTLSVKYSFVENDFQRYGRARTHSAVLGYSHELSPNVVVAMEAGPARTQARGTERNHYGYAATARIARSFQTNRLSLYYSHRPADGSGLGSVSDIHSGGVGFRQALGRRTTLTVDVSGYRGRGRLDNPFSSRAFNGAGALSIALKDHWILSFGGTYRRNWGTGPADMEYERFYVSFRYAAPELWRGVR